jgi:hypothetical protein
MLKHSVFCKNQQDWKYVCFSVTKIPKVFICHTVGDYVSRKTRGIRNAIVVSKATILSKVNVK